jgi:hypothetical protein
MFCRESAIVVNFPEYRLGNGLERLVVAVGGVVEGELIVGAAACQPVY